MNGLGSILSVCRRAGKLVGGTDEVKNAIRKKEARLVITACDLSEKSRAGIEFECRRGGVRCITAPESVYGIAAAVGKPYGVLAVKDKGFADAILKKTENENNIRLED